MNVGPLSLLVLQPTPFCNIDCGYCYLNNRSDRTVMAPEVLELALRRAFECGLIRGRLEILWHSGEPLVVGREFYARATETIARLRPAPVEVVQFLQTNGMLIDERWCEVFRASGMYLGVSLDGPEDIHDAHRKTRSGAGTFQQTMRGIDCLRSAGVPFSVLAVLTKQSLGATGRVLDFFEREGLRELGFNLEEMDGGHRRWSFDSKGEAEALFQGFAREAKQRHLEGRLNIREIKQISERLKSGGMKPKVQAIALRNVTVGADGWFSTFCPELHDARMKDGHRYRFGNVVENDFIDIFANEHFLAVHREVMDGAQKCAATCSRFEICGSPQVGNKYFENGSFDTAETLACRTRIKAVADEIERQPACAAVS